MKFLFRWLRRLILLAIVLVVALLLSKDWILKTVAEHQIRAETGMEARIGRFQVGLLSPVVNLEDFKLYNSAEFGGSPLLNLRELHVEYDATALRARELHLKLLRLNLAEVNIVKDLAGRTNVAFLPGNLKLPQPGAKPGGVLKLGDFTFTGIDTLNLTLGKLKYTDLKDPANDKEINLGVREEIYTNIKSEADLYGVGLMLLLKHGGELKQQLQLPQLPAGSLAL